MVNVPPMIVPKKVHVPFLTPVTAPPTPHPTPVGFVAGAIQVHLAPDSNMPVNVKLELLTVMLPPAAKVALGLKSLPLVRMPELRLTVPVGVFGTPNPESPVTAVSVEVLRVRVVRFGSETSEPPALPIVTVSAKAGTEASAITVRSQ
jgi:hypothetical protein